MQLTLETCRCGTRLLKRLPELFAFLLEELERRAAIERINRQFHCQIHRNALVRVQYGEDIVLGEGVRIEALTYLCVWNEDGLKRNSQLQIGALTYIGEQNNIRAAGGRIEIGRKCLISQQVSIIASNHTFKKGHPIYDQPWDQAKTGVSIADDVWIGCGAQILPGARIGKGAIVAAGSVVTGVVPENTIVAGVPARAIKQRE